MDEKKMDELLNSLTNREKAIITSEMWKQDDTPNPLEKFGIQKIVTGDSAKLMDYWKETKEERERAEYRCVTYPSSSALGAGWNEENAYIVGENIGRSCKLHGVDVLFRPAMNIERFVLCGRNFEYYSEDPVESGELAASFIKGVQSKGISACPKHFVCNSQEFERMTTNAVVGERALREIYMRGFQIAIEKGKPWSIMTSYNRVNGKYVNENKRLMNILRKEFGFDGYITSDGAAVQTGKAAISHQNGMDVELGYSHVTEVQDALDRGELSEEAINENIRHIIELYEKIHSQDSSGIENQDEEHMLARKIAADCAVLLKNDGMLPLIKEKKIAIIGALSKDPNFMGGGSGFSNAYILDSTYDEIAVLLGYQPDYAPAYPIADTPKNEGPIDEQLISEAAKIAEDAEIVIYFTGLPYGYETEGLDRRGLQLPLCQTKALDAVLSVNRSVILVNTSGSAVDLSCYHDLPAILHNYLAGESLGGAIADVLFGVAEPGGRLPETFPMRIQDTPTYLNTVTYPQVKENVLYGEDIFIGYRWYEARDIKPLFPFGYGLSYTEFAYGPLRISQSDITPADKVTVSINVKNTGSRYGTQVIQLYVHKENPSVIRPYKELKAFGKIGLNPGEEKDISLEIDRKAFEYFSEEQNEWIAESGKYQLMIGVSSDEIIDTLPIIMHSKEKGMIYNYNTVVERFFSATGIEEAIDFLSPDKKRFFIPDKEKDIILSSPLASSVPIYHAIKDNSLLIGDKRLTDDELSKVISKLNNM